MNQKSYVSIIILALIMYGSYWFGNLFMATTGLDSMGGFITTVIAGLLPATIAYFVLKRLGSHTDI